MFFRPTPSKLEQAKQAARDAGSALSGAAGNVAESVAGTAHSLLEHAPKVAASVGEAVSAKASVVGGVVSAKASGVGESLSGARDVVAAKVETLRHRAEKEADKAVEEAQTKAAATRKAAQATVAEAETAAREAQQKAESETARAAHELAQQRAEFQRIQRELQEQTAHLDELRAASRKKANEVQAQRKAQVEDFAPVEVKAPHHKEVPVLATPSTTEVANDDDFEYQVVAEKQSGSKLWLVIGGVVFVGAAVTYFFTSRNGRRSKAAIQDRLAKVKDQAVDKVTGAADAASSPRAEHIDTLVEAESPTVIEAQSDHSLGALNAVVTDDVAPASTVALDEETIVASSYAVEGTTVEAYEPLGHIETAASAGSELDEPHHPNIFDKVAEVVGNVAGVAEHLAGEEKDGAKETAEEIEAAAEAAKQETKEEREVSTKKKKK